MTALSLDLLAAGSIGVGLLSVAALLWLVIRGASDPIVVMAPPAPSPAPPVVAAPPPLVMPMVTIAYHDLYGNEVGRESIPKQWRRVTRTHQGGTYQASHVHADGTWHYRACKG